MFDGGVTGISEQHKLLFESCSVIWTQHLQQHTKEEEVLNNMKFSLKGSLRKACNVIQIAQMIRRLLKEGGTDFQSFVRKWNTRTVQSQQIKGRKATSLRLLFEAAPQDVLDNILTHVGVMGWSESCWTEDNLASKRLFPGHSFHTRSRKWASRLKVTDDSFRYMVKKVQLSVETWRPENGKRPCYDLPTMEGVAEKSAALCGMAKEFCKDHPVAPDVVEVKILKAWAEGDERIELELQAALLEKLDQFEVGLNMPCFKAFLDDAIFKAPVSSMQEQELRDALKRDEFDNVIKKLEYDTKVFEIWQSKCQGVTVSRNHAKTEHVVKQHRNTQKAVENYVDGCVRLLTWEGARSSDTLIPQILQFRMDAIKKLKVKVTANEVPTVTLLNWTAPCLMPANRQKDHSSVLSWAMHDNLNSCGLIFSPVFSHHKGKTFLEENAALSILSSGGHNLDHQFSLLFQERCDARDGRPLLYPARFAFPGHIVDLGKSAPFFQSELRKNGRTEACKQMAAKDLKEIEDVAEDSLPSVTGIGYVSGAAKYSQFGLPAAEEVLKKLFQGASLENVHAVLLLDLNPRVGDFAQAFCKLRNQLGCSASLFYCAVGDKGKDLDWMRLSLIEDLVDKAKHGQIQIPGMTPHQQEISSDLLEPLPTLPIMNLLVTTGEAEFKKLQIPHHLVKKWRADDEFGDEFGKWLDGFCEKYSVTEESQPTSETTSPQKTTAGGTAEVVEPSPKRLKADEVAADKIFENDLIKDALLFDCKKLFLVNLTQQEQILKSGASLIGFGRGNFKLFKEGDPLPEKALTYMIPDSDTLVCLNGALMTISDVVHQQRSKNPEAQVCYYETNHVPETQKKYTFKMKHKVVFVPAGKAASENAEKEEKEVALAASNIGAKEVPTTFCNLHCCQLVWWVRWTVKGLQPTKAMLHMTKRLTLPAGKSCQLTL
ncbi:Uncharacterized protein SCF082_LOCUS1126 [Durusdinium trenchii]|uniref:Uncharacterized protein n=1 Tax=Durusdinium trenchii TaxID=1381693 RepID=A0ABP0HC42_9DINO